MMAKFSVAKWRPQATMSFQHYILKQIFFQEYNMDAITLRITVALLRVKWVSVEIKYGITQLPSIYKIWTSWRPDK